MTIDRRTLLPSLAAACLGVGALLSAAGAQPASADPGSDAPRLLVPQRAGDRVAGCFVSKVDAAARIDGAVATTTLKITVTNPTRSRSQARLVLPVPGNAAVHAFGIDGVGDEPTAELLPRDEAVRRYEEIVRRAVDPGLLEFVGSGLLQSSVFPVEPGAERTLTVTYEHAMPAHAGRVEYVLPRSSSMGEGMAPWTLTVDVVGAGTLGPVFSPSHPVITKATGPDSLRLTVPSLKEPGAFRLYAVTGSEGGEATCLAYPEDEDSGWFVFVADAPEPADAEPMPRELTLVIDRSGSMGGRKIEQAKESARQVVAGLRDGERLQIISYAGDVLVASKDPVVISDASRREAMAWIDRIEARGSTNLHDALAEALRPDLPDRYLGVVLFLTDGLPTDGVTGEADIRAAARRLNTEGRRVFTFGVGTDVNAPLLDGVARDTRAESTFVLPNEDVELKVAQVFDKLDGPVMVGPVFTTHAPDGTLLDRKVDPAVTFVHPDELGDLFRGSRVMVVGRYDHDGPITLRIAPEDGGAAAVEAVLDPAEASTRHGFVPRLWAQRRIDALLTRIRLDTADGSEPDAELIDEVVRLSLEHGVMTEYTAFLAEEDLGLADAAAPQDDDGNLGIAYRLTREQVAGQNRERSGTAGVSQTMNRGDVAARQAAPAAVRTGSKLEVFAVKSNTWYDAGMRLRSATTIQRDLRGTLYRKQDRWVDARLGESADESPDKVVEFGTDEYWALVADLASQHRQWMLANRGEVYLVNRGERVLVRNPS